AALAELMASLDSALLRVATTHVGSRAVAEEVVQDTWLGVIRGINGFEGRSSLRTWIFRILKNVAATRGARERGTLPFSSLEGDDGRRFDPSGHWLAGPVPWKTPEERLIAAETLEVAMSAIDALPPAQRRVISLRDVEGWDAAETCEALGLAEGNQRVLLHRARTTVRAALASYRSDL
ncbi:MAG: RNA polymerase sigma factor, partial [Thermoleophilaceae bacterium]